MFIVNSLHNIVNWNVSRCNGEGRRGGGLWSFAERSAVMRRLPNSENSVEKS